jgi:hypothetical protein
LDSPKAAEGVKLALGEKQVGGYFRTQWPEGVSNKYTPAARFVIGFLRQVKANTNSTCDYRPFG